MKFVRNQKSFGGRNDKCPNISTVLIFVQKLHPKSPTQNINEFTVRKKYP